MDVFVWLLEWGGSRLHVMPQALARSYSDTMIK
jgi:hypothetical protein